jgi:hypothetical protein
MESTARRQPQPNERLHAARKRRHHLHPWRVPLFSDGEGNGHADRRRVDDRLDVRGIEIAAVDGGAVDLRSRLGRQPGQSGAHDGGGARGR